MSLTNPLRNARSGLRVSLPSGTLKPYRAAWTVVRGVGAAASALLLVGSGTLIVEQPARAAAVTPGATCDNGWREMRVPDQVFLSTPFDVVTRRGQPAWIVGGTNTGVLALSWSGSAWKQQARATSGHRGLSGAATIGPNRLLGVGYFRPYRGEGEGSLQPISGRVVGGHWKGRAVPDPPGPRASLTDVVALPKGKAIAVGTRLVNGRDRAYGLFWNGSKWIRSEPWGGTGSGLLGVNRSGSGGVWAVGWKESAPGRPRPYIVRRAGRRWKTVPSAPLPAGSGVLTNVHFRGAHDGWAVGYLARRGSDAPHVILMHWDGGTWTSVDLPWASDFAAVPRSVSVGQDGTIWIAGTKTATNNREPRGFIAHGRGADWRVDSLGTPGDIRSEMMSVATTDDGAVAAASVGASLLVLATCGQNATAAAPAAASRGTTSRRLGVSQMARRRRSARLDSDEPVDERDASARVALPSGGTAWSVAGADAQAYALASRPRSDPHFYVRDMAVASGLRQWTRTFDGFTADIDGNGWTDVFYSRHGGIRPRLALNGPNGFTNAPGGAFGSVDRHGCDHADVDDDGHVDILCAVGASRGKAVKRHELSLAPATSSGSVALDTLGIEDPLGRGRAVGFLHLDKDPYPEVFIADAPDRDDGWPGYNRFYRNVKGHFVPAPGVGLDSSHGATCVLTGDVDQDGDEDLVYCTQYGFNGRRAGLRFMRNENGRLKDRTAQLGIRQIGDIDVTFADVTGDGRKDLIQLAPNRLRVSRWTPSGYRKIYELAITDAWAVAAGDASGDGLADIYIVRGTDARNKPDRLLVSKAHGTKFVSVRIPTTSKGVADDVMAIDYDRNGLKDFVVLNGRTNKRGPVQLLASFPRS